MKAASRSKDWPLAKIQQGNTVLSPTASRNWIQQQRMILDLDVSSGPPERITAMPTPWFWPCEILSRAPSRARLLQNCEIIYVCGFKLLNLQQFVTAAVEINADNDYKCLVHTGCTINVWMDRCIQEIHFWGWHKKYFGFLHFACCISQLLLHNKQLQIADKQQ